MIDPENKTMDGAVIDNVEKLLIYSIEKMYTNLSEFKHSPAKRTRGEIIADRRANPYMYVLQEMLESLLNKCLDNKFVNFLLPKLLLGNLNILYNFYYYRFFPNKFEPPLPTDDPEKTKEYFEKLRINLPFYFKTLLKEFNLMKFYKQIADISGIKTSTKFGNRINRKIKIVENLLKYIRKLVHGYRCKIFFIDNNCVCWHFNKGYYNYLSPVVYYMPFYYWIKITNSLLKQYTQTMNDDKLEKKINIRLYQYLSIIIVSLCMGEALNAVHELIKYAYLNPISPIKRISTNDVKKLLDKISKVLKDIYFIMIYGNEDTPFLIKSCRKPPYIDPDVIVIINVFFLDKIKDIRREIERGLVNRILPIKLTSESGREDLYYMLRTAGEIDSIKNAIYKIVYNHDNFVTKKLNK